MLVNGSITAIVGGCPNPAPSEWTTSAEQGRFDAEGQIGVTVVRHHQGNDGGILRLGLGQNQRAFDQHIRLIRLVEHGRLIVHEGPDHRAVRAGPRPGATDLREGRTRGRIKIGTRHLQLLHLQRHAAAIVLFGDRVIFHVVRVGAAGGRSQQAAHSMAPLPGARITCIPASRVQTETFRFRTQNIRTPPVSIETCIFKVSVGVARTARHPLKSIEVITILTRKIGVTPPIPRRPERIGHPHHVSTTHIGIGFDKGGQVGPLLGCRHVPS